MAGACGVATVSTATAFSRRTRSLTTPWFFIGADRISDDGSLRRSQPGIGGRTSPAVTRATPDPPSYDTLDEDPQEGRDRASEDDDAQPRPSRHPTDPPFKANTWRGVNLDWGRRHLQIMFVDENHGVLARGAEGCCQRVAAWAGAGHMVFPESSGLLLEEDGAGDGAGDGEDFKEDFVRSFDEEMRMMTRLAPICDHLRYAAKPRYKFTDADAACADIIVTVGGDDVEARVLAAAPTAAAVVDLWEFAQFAELGEIDGTGAAKVLKRSLATEVVSPVLNELMATTGLGSGAGSGSWSGSGSVLGGTSENKERTYALKVKTQVGGVGAGGFEMEEKERERELGLLRARLVIGVVGLVTFLMATAPLEEVERYCRKNSTWATGGAGRAGLEGLEASEKEEETEEDAGDVEEEDDEQK